MTRDQILAVLAQYFEALKEQRIDDLPITDDVTFEGPMAGAKRGRSEVAQIASEAAKAFESVELEVLDHVVDSDSACTRTLMTLPSGRTVGLLDYFRFRDGKISHIQPYFDTQPMEEIWGHTRS